jgi:hypothetical protein
VPVAYIRESGKRVRRLGAAEIAVVHDKIHVRRRVDPVSSLLRRGRWLSLRNQHL